MLRFDQEFPRPGSNAGRTPVTGGDCRGDRNSDGHGDACGRLFIIPLPSGWGLIILTLLPPVVGGVIPNKADRAIETPCRGSLLKNVASPLVGDASELPVRYS